MGKERKIGGMDYFAYACSALVYILPQYLLSSFLSAYYTDVALVSAGAVGAVVLAMRFTDGISDLCMGRIIDKTNSRFGKARPWLLVGTVGLAVTLLTVFHVPAGLPAVAKIAWLAVAYFLIMTVFGTVQGVASNTMIIYLTNDSQKRNKFGASNMAGVYVGGLVATTVTTVLLGAFGYTQAGYDKTMYIYSAEVLFFGIFSFVRLKETQNETNKDMAGEKVPMGTIVRSMFQNHYYVFAVVAGLLLNLTNGIITGLGVYFCRDIFGNANLYALVTLALLLPTLFALPLAVMVAKKLGHHKTLMYGRVGYIVGVVVEGIALLMTNLPLFFVGVAFSGLCSSTFAACFTARVANICDYGEWKYRTNASGIMMSATSFCNKVGLGLGSAITGVILEIARYDGALAKAGAAQSAYTVAVERYAVAFVPIVLNIIVAVCLYKSNVDPQMGQVQKGLAERRGEK